jgi:enoyl-[acyl-carrier-protein] reductase (NADH)
VLDLARAFQLGKHTALSSCPRLTPPTCRGASVARKFASKYSVALLARNPANYEPLVKEIEAAGGKAVGISTDVVDGASVSNAFEKIKAEMKGAPLAAAVFNVGGKFVRKPFLELTEEEFVSGMEANGYDEASCSTRAPATRSPRLTLTFF